jgi:GAF domain-containing protein
MTASSDDEIAELRRANAELRQRLDEGLAREAATAEVLQVINSSPGNLGPVFDAILDKAMCLCDAVHGHIWIYDGERAHPVAVRGEPRLVEWMRRLGSMRPGSRPLGHLSPLDRVVRGERLVHVADARDEEAYRSSPMYRELADVGGVRTILDIGVRKGGALFGVIALYRQEVRPFTEKQIALLENFAAQAVIAMENARLLTETREALEQQTATSEVLQVINSSPGNLAPVFDAMLEKALKLCGAAFGGLWTFGEDRYVAVALRGVPKAYAEFLDNATMVPGPGTAPYRLKHGEPIVHNLDLAAEEAYRTGDPQRCALVDLGGARTALQVSLRKDEEVLGVITIYRQEVRPFSDKQIALLQNFAAQAVIAMENARLLTETREALEQQTATAEVLQVINSSPGDLQPVFDAILEKAHTLCGADLGSFAVNDGERMPAVATRGYPEQHAALAREGLPTNGPQGERLARGEIIHVDLAQPPAEPIPDRIASDTRRAAVEITGTRTYLAVPLRKDGALLGYLSAHRREVRAFSDREIALLQNFAAQAVIAIENARLINEMREALEQQTATAEVLQVINSSPGDLAPVFDAMLEKATELCEAAFGVLRTWDGERFHFAAAFGNSRLTEWARKRPPFTPERATILGRIVGGESLVTMVDALSDQTSVFREMAEVSGMRSVVTVALRKHAALVGSLTVYRQEVHPFTDKQIALLQNFAAQAVIAMENARLIDETREALEQQTATAEVLQVINASPGDLAPVFQAILEKAHSLCDVSHGSLQLYDAEKFRAVAVHGFPDTLGNRLRHGYSLGPNNPLWPLLEGERFVHVPDLAEIDDPISRNAAELGGTRTLLCVALRKDDKLLGQIAAARREVRPFSEKEISLLQNFAAQAVIAMENARLVDELRQRTDQVAELNRGLEARVAEQVEELGRVGRLKRFLAPQLAELIVSHGDENILESHRREIVVVFCDLRGYTAFTETAEPEEVLDFLREYHGALGPLVSQFEGTLDQFSGDGIMVFFNDPVPCPDPAERAVKMAVAMREAAGALITDWRERGRELGFGAGIAQGYATLGQIGFAERSGYTAIGTVCNVAARLCAEAKDGQILLSQRVNVALRGSVATEQVGALALKGLTQPVVAYNVPLGASQPALRVIEGGPPSV